MIEHALAILTYVPAGRSVNLRKRLPWALKSLEASGYPGPVFIVDDGSTDRRHLATLKRLETFGGRFRVVRRLQNGGVSRAKNTCLRLLAETACHIGFIAEDDVEFHSGWHCSYLAAHAATGIEHFSWAWDRDPSGKMRKSRRTIGGHGVVQSSRLNGALLTFTPRVIERVGGFRLLPGKWGHEHSNWTRRIVMAGLAPFFADVVASNRLIGISPYGRCSAVRAASREAWERENYAPAHDLSRIHFPLAE